MKMTRPVASVAALVGLAGFLGQSNLADDVTVLGKSSDGLSQPATDLLNEAKARAKTRVTAAGLGGLTGLVAGIYGASQTRDARVQAAAIGGGLTTGTALGYAAGASIDERNMQAANEQVALNCMTYAVGMDTARYRQDRLRARAAIDESQAQLEQLHRQQASGAAMTGTFRTQAKNLEATAAMRSMIHELGDVMAVMRTDIAGLAARGQDTEGLQAEHDGLMSKYRRLLAVVETMPASERPVMAAGLP
jgi:hypothetical protein